VSRDGFQREALAELGLVVYALAGTGAVTSSQTSAPEPPPPTLLHALLRAAAADHAHTDVLALCREFLAANPNPSAQARRALWPMLRRLRRVPSSA